MVNILIKYYYKHVTKQVANYTKKSLKKGNFRRFYKEEITAKKAVKKRTTCVAL